MSRFISVLFLAAALSAPVSAATNPPPELPVETLFQIPTISSLSFSPNGKYILCVVPYERRQNLAVIDLEKGTKSLLTNFKDKQVDGPIWANDERILFRVDDDGKESYALYAVNRDGSDPAILASGYSKASTTGELNARFSGILSRLPNDPRGILVLANITNNDWSDVARLDLKTSRMSVVAKAPGAVVEDGYIVDHDGQVRFAVVLDPDNMIRVLYRDANGQDWTELDRHHRAAAGWMPIAFDGDNRSVIVLSNVGRKTRAFYRFDTKTKQLGEMIAGDDTYDFAPTYGDRKKIIYDPATKKIVGLGYEADRTRFHWIDPDFEKLHRQIESSLPNTVHLITQISDDGSRVIFNSYSDRDPGVYYLFDRKRQKLSELAVIRPQIDPEQMATMKPVTYAARDGLVLHGYLTLPVGREPKNLPLIVHPHGGPYGPRDRWGYNPEVQFYANRGFAVLQVNYRGSGGYGDWFEAAGFKKWGLEMQDDLSDGVKWLIAQGIANPKRVVISGASYGGYATMAGLTYTPELYCAGINYVGVVDIEMLIPKGVASSRLYWPNTRLGDLDNAADRKRIYDTSPVHFADRIQVPLLMAYGENDPRVRIDHAYEIERALKRNGRPYELIIEAGEGHGFRKEEKKIAFYARVDSFLKKHVLAPQGEAKPGELRVVEMPAKSQ